MFDFFYVRLYKGIKTDSDEDFEHLFMLAFHVAPVLIFAQELLPAPKKHGVEMINLNQNQTLADSIPVKGCKIFYLRPDGDPYFFIPDSLIDMLGIHIDFEEIIVLPGIKSLNHQEGHVVLPIGIQAIRVRHDGVLGYSVLGFHHISITGGGLVKYHQDQLLYLKVLKQKSKGA